MKQCIEFNLHALNQFVNKFLELLLPENKTLITVYFELHHLYIVLIQLEKLFIVIVNNRSSFAKKNEQKILSPSQKFYTNRISVLRDIQKNLQIISYIKEVKNIYFA